jgi:putative transposase
MKSGYTAKELSGKIGMPSTVRGVKARAARENWPGQRRSHSKAIEYPLNVLPTETQVAIIAAQTQACSDLEDNKQNVPEKGKHTPLSATMLNDAQRLTMGARLSFVLEIKRMTNDMTQKKAIDTILALSKKHMLDLFLQDRLLIANDRSTPASTLSERTLKRWISKYREHGEIGLVPCRSRKKPTIPPWSTDFLRCYQRPTKPSIEASYKEFCKKCTTDQPSIHQVRRFLDKLSPEARNIGRHTAQQLKAFQPFRRRATEDLMPCDVFTADGHKFDAEIINPRTGKPYRPEITTVLDVATRKVVGISIGESESAIAVIDALRDAVQHGVFALLYVDNGSGFANDTVREVVERLGGTLTYALPYNSQARGLVERAHKSIWVNAAKKLTSYIGADMDRHAGSKSFRISRKQIREHGGTSLIPSFETFMAGIEYEIEAYNNAPHRGLTKVRDTVTGKRRHLSPNETWARASSTGWQAIIAPSDVLDDVMRPQVIRPTNRGEINWAGNKYFLNSLRDLHGTDVRISYDLRDASKVWVRNLNGELIGEAHLDGNASPYMPKSMVEQAYEKREHGQIRRTLEKLKKLSDQNNHISIAEYSSAPTLDTARLAEAKRVAVALIESESAPFALPTDPIEKYRLWQKLNAGICSGLTLTNDESIWHSNYQTNVEFFAMRRMFDHIEN